MSDHNLDVNVNEQQFFDTNKSMVQHFTDLLTKYNHLRSLHEKLLDTHETLLESHEKLKNELSQNHGRALSPPNQNQSIDQNVSFDNINFTSSGAASESNESLVPSTPPLPIRTKSNTSTPLRLASNKENVMRAPKSITKQNSKHDNNNTSSVRNEWLSKSINEGNTSRGAINKWKTPDKLLMNDDSDLFKFPNDTETIPASIEAIKINKKRGNLSHVSGRLKQKRIDFPKKSQNKKNSPPRFQPVAQQDDETYCEGLTMQEDNITFSEDEGFNISSNSNKSCVDNGSHLLSSKSNDLSVIAIENKPDEIIVIPDTQDVYYQVMGVLKPSDVAKPSAKSSPPHPQLTIKQTTTPKPAIPMASVTSNAAPSKTPSRTGCAECDDWYNIMGGPAVGYGNKKKKPHMCINQRRNQGRAETPPGFWNPIIPDTPEDQRRPQLYDDRLLKRK